jgi:hypothetical protein
VPAAHRAAFVDAVGADDAALARSRGAAVAQACAALPYYLRTYPLMAARAAAKLAALGVAVAPDVGGAAARRP